MLALFKSAATALQNQTFILREGLSQIPLAATEGSDVLLSHKVTQVARKKNGMIEVVAENVHDEKVFVADGVVCAVPASVVPGILEGLSLDQRAFFASVSYASTVVASYALQHSGVSRSYAIAYPRETGVPIGAMTVLSDLSATTDVVKLYASGVSGKRLCAQSDEYIHRVLFRAAGAGSGDYDRGSWSVQRWPEAIPEFSVEHLDNLQRFANGEIEDETQPIVFAGDYLGGPFLEGAFTSGTRAARRLLGMFDF